MPAPLHLLPLLILYPFRYRETLTGKWVRARYLAERQEIEARHHDWEIIGPPEHRSVGGGSFTPWQTS